MRGLWGSLGRWVGRRGLCRLRECEWGWMDGVDMPDEMTELAEALDDDMMVMMVWILYE